MNRPARRPRRKPVQLSIAARGGGRGGYRAGAGRKPKPPEERKGHGPRPVLPARFPVHVTMRVLPGIDSLRRGPTFRVLRRCFAAGKDRFGFRLVHFSAQSNHLHLICEAGDRTALSRGMQGLAIRIARRLNRRLRRRGRLFAERYHARVLRTPSEVRHALRYVLGNARHHAGRPLGRDWVDPCSSAAYFTGWRRPIRDMRVQPRGQPPVVPARVWLLSKGWRRAGPLGSDEKPG